MKKAEIGLNHVYQAKVAGKLAPVRILAHHPNGGWIGRNEATKREIRIRSAARLRREIGWGRLDRIRALREQGLSYEDARARVDASDQASRDHQCAVNARQVAFVRDGEVGLVVNGALVAGPTQGPKINA